jgi:hypothetical protein
MKPIQCILLTGLLASLLTVQAAATEPAPGDKDVPAATPAPSSASDRLQLDATSVRGNQELPRVLYIVPWKDPAVGDLLGKPVNSLVDEVLGPVDREVFRRQTAYFDQLYGQAP